MSVSKEAIYRARNADLFAFLARYHSPDIIHEGKYIRLKEHHSIVIEKGHSHYVRYSSKDEIGNPIDLLVSYLGYSFGEAVAALNCTLLESVSYTDIVPSAPQDLQISSHEIVFPRMGEQPFRRVYAYLTLTRMLSPKVVNWLIRMGLLYQDEQFGNAVFINAEHTYAEIRGTLSNVKFHRCIRTVGDASFWSFKTSNRPSSVAYICEGAIDAISLYELHRSRWHMNLPGTYCSIGGVGNQRLIEAIEREGYPHLILAVDNDSSGERCRQANRHLECLVPKEKDWNECLVNWKSM